MKRRIITSLLLVVIAVTSLFTMPVTMATDDLPNYAPLPGEENKLFETQMFLGAWCEPEGTEQQVQWFKDCGFNVTYIKEQQKYDGGGLYHDLDLFDKYGIKAMLSLSASRTDPISWRSSKNSLDHPAILGFCLCDEPLGNGLTQYKDTDKTIIDYKVTAGLAYERSAATQWQTKYTEKKYPTIYDYMYYEAMTYLYGDFEYNNAPGTVNFANGEDEAYFNDLTKTEADLVERYRTGTNSDGTEFNRIFTAVISNRAQQGTFGYEALKSYCESILTGKHDVTRDDDNSIPVPKKDRFLEIDLYPYSKNSRTGEFKINSTYMNRLMEFRYYIDAYEAPMSNVYYQNWFVDDMLPYIDKGALTQQFYTIMSYGIKGLTVWYYNMYWFDYRTDNEVMIDEYLQKTDLWYYNQEAFAELEAFDYAYLQFCDNWQGIMTINGTEHSTGGEGMFASIDNDPYTFGREGDNYSMFDYAGSSRTPEQAKAYAESYVANHHLTSYAGIESVTATGDTSIGIMKDGAGRDGYVITNQNFVIDRISNTVNIDFAGANRVLMWKNGQQIVQNLTDGKLTLELGVGEGVFAIPLP